MSDTTTQTSSEHSYSKIWQLKDQKSVKLFGLCTYTNKPLLSQTINFYNFAANRHHFFNLVVRYVKDKFEYQLNRNSAHKYAY